MIDANGLRVFFSFRFSAAAYLFSIPIAAGASNISGGINISALYSALLGVMSISLGFLAGFYLMLIGGQHSFLAKISATRTFASLRSLIEWTMAIMAACASSTIALSALEPEGSAFSVGLAGIIFWSFFVAMTLINTFRCFRIFAKLN